jgi:hypothetical protein
LDEVARARLFGELYDLRQQIEEREANLSDAMERLESFRMRWLEELGERLIECARLRAEVATAFAQSRSDDQQAVIDADDAQARAQQAVAEWEAVGAPSEPREPPDENLRALYREAARRFHPDLASDPDDCARRTEVMARVNAAYAARDAGALRHILSTPDDRIEREQPGSDRQLLADVASAWRTLDGLEQALSALESADYWLLLLEEKQAAAEGRSLIEETREILNAEIAELRHQLDGVPSGP